MSPREQVEAIALLRRWLDIATGKTSAAAYAMLRAALVMETKEFIDTSNTEDVR